MISSEQSGNVGVIAIMMESMDASNVKELKEELVSIMQRNPRQVFDMTRVQFVDSSGLSVLVSCLRQVNKAGGDLKLCGLSKPVRALFELVRMHKIFDIFESSEEAVKAFDL